MTFYKDIRQWVTVADFAAHLAAHDPSIALWAQGLTIHHTVSPDVPDWRGKDSMESMAYYYEHTKGWDRGPHLYLCVGANNPQDDGIWQLTPLNMPGIHAGDCNEHYWGMEIVGNYDNALWSEALEDLIYGAGVALFTWRSLAYHPQLVLGHRECLQNKTCPGANIDMDYVRANFQYIMAGDVPDQLLPYTENSPILSAGEIPMQHWLNTFCQNEHGEYTPYDIEQIVRGYVAQCASLGVNHDIALAQCAKETDWLSSAWAARPQRNPAGIGVNGQTRTTAPPSSEAGEWVLFDGVWHHGNSFAAWVDKSIPAQLGRILAYVLPEGQGTDAQHAAIKYALSVRPLPVEYRGRGNYLWAIDPWAANPGYGGRVGELANQVAGY